MTTEANGLQWCGECISAYEHPNDPSSRCYTCKRRRDFVKAETHMEGSVNPQKRIAALEAENAKLREQTRWIPVSERMPDDWESVLTIDISKSTQDVVSAFYNPDTSLWATGLWVTHWMPLPEPPIVYGKACIDQLTAHDATERQDDKWIPEVE